MWQYIYVVGLYQQFFLVSLVGVVGYWRVEDINLSDQDEMFKKGKL